MILQPSLTDNEPSCHLQVEAHQDTSLHGVGLRQGLPWVVLGLLGIVLVGASACAILPLASHAASQSGSARPSSLVTAAVLDPHGSALRPRSSLIKREPSSASLRRPLNSRSVDRAKPQSINMRAQVQAFTPYVPHVASPPTVLSMSAQGGDGSGSAGDARASENMMQLAAQLPREEWPAGKKWYRFIPGTAEGFAAQSLGNLRGNPTSYTGTRAKGAYKGSNRVTFSLPKEDATFVGDEEAAPQIRTMEFLRSKEKDLPSFGAVEVQLPLNMDIHSFGVGKLFSGQARVVVTDVYGKKAQNAGIQAGDMIRAVSVPEGVSSDNMWEKAPETEQGMAMLDNNGAGAYQAAILANERAHGKNAKVVLVIERSVSDPNNDDDWFKPGGPGFPQLVSNGWDKMVEAAGGGGGKLAGAPTGT